MIKITRQFPHEQFGYTKVEFDALEEYVQNYKAVRKAVKEQEKITPEPPEFKREGNFMLNNNK